MEHQRKEGIMKFICIIFAVICIILASNEVVSMLAVLVGLIGFLGKICKEATDK